MLNWQIVSNAVKLEYIWEKPSKLIYIRIAVYYVQLKNSPINISYSK